ncbi:hypothetical protein PR048_006793 [Dryococelus australis]|uniref:Uncharacterized protein n=1 Tax=Dryococelus australis TaxID=614101 RepID=A0ABQ9IBX6_9NEOP|nr:hypothetical protein PR048_006793 [Dryococelus australis]
MVQARGFGIRWCEWQTRNGIQVHREQETSERINWFVNVTEVGLLQKSFEITRSNFTAQIANCKPCTCSTMLRTASTESYDVSSHELKSSPLTTGHSKCLAGQSLPIYRPGNVAVSKSAAIFKVAVQMSHGMDGCRSARQLLWASLYTRFCEKSNYTELHIAASGGPVTMLACGQTLLASHQDEPGSIPGRVTLPDFRQWESCRTMTLVNGFSLGSPVSPSLAFRRRSILISFRPQRLGYQDLDSKSRPNFSTPNSTNPHILLRNNQIGVTGSLSNDGISNGGGRVNALPKPKAVTFRNLLAVINEETLERESAALNCKCFRGIHSYDRIAEMVFDIHSDYGLSRGDSEVDSDEVDAVQFLDIDIEEGTKAILVSATGRIHHSAIGKCSAIWNLSRRQKSSEVITNILGYSLIYPCLARWNSLYDSIVALMKHQNKLPEVIEKIGLACNFKEAEVEYLQEYVEVMRPIALALDCLQLETNCFHGQLLPTLFSFEYKLRAVTSGWVSACPARWTERACIHHASDMTRAKQDRWGGGGHFSVFSGWTMCVVGECPGSDMSPISDVILPARAVGDRGVTGSFTSEFLGNLCQKHAGTPSANHLFLNAYLPRVYFTRQIGRCLTSNWLRSAAECYNILLASRKFSAVFDFYGCELFCWDVPMERGINTSQQRCHSLCFASLCFAQGPAHFKTVRAKASRISRLRACRGRRHFSVFRWA